MSESKATPHKLQACWIICIAVHMLLVYACEDAVLSLSVYLLQPCDTWQVRQDLDGLPMIYVVDATLCI